MTRGFFDDERKEYPYKQLADVELFLLGRVTYDVLLGTLAPDQR
jgi:hypothetical protein